MVGKSTLNAHFCTIVGKIGGIKENLGGDNPLEVKAGLMAELDQTPRVLPVQVWTSPWKDKK